VFSNTAHPNRCATLELRANEFLLQSRLNYTELGIFMTLPSLQPNQFSEDATWDSLKQVIASSSGFQRWLAERALVSGQVQNINLEQLVSRYLRETLETLAY